MIGCWTLEAIGRNLTQHVVSSIYVYVGGVKGSQLMNNTLHVCSESYQHLSSRLSCDFTSKQRENKVSRWTRSWSSKSSTSEFYCPSRWNTCLTSWTDCPYALARTLKKKKGHDSAARDCRRFVSHQTCTDSSSLSHISHFHFLSSPFSWITPVLAVLIISLVSCFCCCLVWINFIDTWNNCDCYGCFCRQLKGLKLIIVNFFIDTIIIHQHYYHYHYHHDSYNHCYYREHCFH